jgi:DNA-directed RNA polymerase specialized sigma24 family protein
MERASALRLLPATHAQAIELSDRGLAPAEIAARLGLEPSAGPSLVAIARQKLEALEALHDPADSNTPATSPTQPTRRQP